MAVLVRIAVIVLAYVLACIAASLILTIGTLTPEWDDLTALGMQSVAVWAVVMVGAAVIGGIAMMRAARHRPYRRLRLALEPYLCGARRRIGIVTELWPRFRRLKRRTRKPFGARARGACRRWHCRRFCLLVVRRPQSGLLEVIRITTSSGQRS
jgi:hypothetical protein